MKKESKENMIRKKEKNETKIRGVPYFPNSSNAASPSDVV